LIDCTTVLTDLGPMSSCASITAIVRAVGFDSGLADCRVPEGIPYIFRILWLTSENGSRLPAGIRAHLDPFQFTAKWKPGRPGRLDLRRWYRDGAGVAGHPQLHLGLKVGTHVTIASECT